MLSLSRSLWAPLETWPMASAILVSLTSACDIITHWPDINPNNVCSHRKKSNTERQFLTGSHPANAGIVRCIALQLLWVCLRRYEIFMETSNPVVCFHFRFNVFACTGRWEYRPGACWQRSIRQKGKRKGGIIEGARKGGSEVRQVKGRWREGMGQGGPMVQGM